LVDYKNNNTKVQIKCPEHGIFEQTPRGHLTYGCPKCHIRGYSKDNWVKIAEKNNFSHVAVFVHRGIYNNTFIDGVIIDGTNNNFNVIPDQYNFYKLI